VPARFGERAALILSVLLHVGVAALLLLLHSVAGLGPVYLAGAGLAILLLAYEHLLVRPGDLSRVNAAFFTTNGFVSLGLMLFTILDVLLG